jgi:hypothetical protein
LAARAAARQRERAEKAASEAVVAEERRRGVRLEDVRAGGARKAASGSGQKAGLGAPAALGDECTIVWWRGT